jgi:hypothetical protein
VDQTVAELGGDDLGDVLVFGDHLDLFIGEFAESETVAEGQHGKAPAGKYCGDGWLYSRRTRIRQAKVDADVIVRRCRMTIA